MTIAQTPRLRLRRLVPDDAPFILRLLNDPGWLRFIGDKNVRTLDDARRYIENGPMAMVARHGLGLDLVELHDGTPIGMCGLIRRDGLDDVDIGFAFLPEHRGAGLAFEAAEATLRHAREALGLRRVVAIASPDNERSARLLERLGLQFQRQIPWGEPAEPLSFFAIDFGTP